MKLDIVTQWVQVPHEQSLANSSLAKSTGKTGNGSPKLDGARLQALHPKGISVGHIESRKMYNCGPFG